MSRASSVLFVLGGLILGFATVSAAEIWIEAEPRSVDSRQGFEVRVRSGDPASVSGAEFGRGRIQRVWRSGREFLALSESGTVRVEPSAPGLQLLAFESADGRRFAKALVAVGPLTGGNPLRWSELGHRLELVPQFDPADLAGLHRPLEIQLLFDREPVYGARIEALAEGGGDPLRAMTDEIGVARLRLNRTGRWILRVRHDEPTGAGRHAGRHTATLSLVVPGAASAQ